MCADLWEALELQKNTEEMKKTMHDILCYSPAQWLSSIDYRKEYRHHVTGMWKHFRDAVNALALPMHEVTELCARVMQCVETEGIPFGITPTWSNNYETYSPQIKFGMTMRLPAARYRQPERAQLRDGLLKSPIQRAQGIAPKHTWRIDGKIVASKKKNN